jgi:hypothetical protein
MALRIGLFYTAASLSGAFGGKIYQMSHTGLSDLFIGLLARGLTAIGVVGRQQPWTWIFIIEGLLVRALHFPLDLVMAHDSTDRGSCCHRLLITAEYHCICFFPKAR